MKQTNLDIDENGKYISPPPPGTIVYLAIEDTPPPGTLNPLDMACVVINGSDGIARFVRLVESSVSERGVYYFVFEDGFYVSQKAALAAVAKEDLVYYRKKISMILDFIKQLGIDPPPENPA